MPAHRRITNAEDQQNQTRDDERAGNPRAIAQPDRHRDNPQHPGQRRGGGDHKKHNLPHPDRIFLGAPGADAVIVTHALILAPLDFCHCYSRHFVDNLRQRPRRRGFLGPLTGPLQQTAGDSRHAAVHVPNDPGQSPRAHPRRHQRAGPRHQPLFCATTHCPQAPIDPYQFIPLGKYVALFEQAALLTQRPLPRPKLGQAFRPELLGPLGFIFQASADLRQALQQLSSYVSVWQSATRWS